MTRFGYKVTTEHCFEDANVRIGRDISYSIVVTDLQLDNGHSGWDLVAKALDAHPDCRVVAVSGHLPQDDLFSDRFPERFSKLPKPVDAEALAEKIGMKLHVPA
jgi:DNA-binding NtrC family response regulator